MDTAFTAQMLYSKSSVRQSLLWHWWCTLIIVLNFLKIVSTECTLGSSLLIGKETLSGNV